MPSRDRTPPPLPPRNAPPVPPRKKKPKPPPVYVEVRYPLWLGIASFAWTMLGWTIAAAAPHLAFMPLIGLLNYLFPLATVGLIGLNLLFAVRDLTRGAHPLRLLLVTGLQVGLFTTLYFQIFAHLGAEHYAVDGPVAAWQWVVFSFAHALRASDLVDVIEAYSLHIQRIRHDSVFVAVFVILYHIVIDVFVLGVLWNVVNRIRRRLLKDDDIRMYAIWAGVILFSIWLLVWILVAFVIYPWNPIDVPLWFLENVLRVFDFGDIMESFEIRLHRLPREGINGTLTFFCRVWIAIGIAWLLGRRRKPAEKRVLTPPGEEPLPYWAKRVGMVVGILLAVLTFGMLVQAIVGDPTARLAAAVSEGDEARSMAALAGLRRMGPTAGAAAPGLVAAREKTQPPLRDEITRTLGYMGTAARKPLEQIALTAPAGDETSAIIAIDGLRRVGPESAATLVEVWRNRPGPAAEAAEEALTDFGTDAVPALLAATSAENALHHHKWCTDLDRNWTLRNTTNPFALALQQLPPKEQLENISDPAVFRQLLNCGSAIKLGEKAALARVDDPDEKVQAAAADVIKAIGPSLTPQLLQKTDPQGNVDPRMVRLLATESMWDEAAIKEPGAVLFLVRMLDLPKDMDSEKRFAIDMLGKVGAGGREVVPKLLVMLGDDDKERRESIRETLTKIYPDWKKHPQNCRAIPKLAPWLVRLPPSEADELGTALGELQPQEVDAFISVLRNVAHESDKKKPKTREDETKAKTREDDKKTRSFAGHPILVRMKSQVKAALPALVKIMENKSNEDQQLAFRIRCSLVDMDLREPELKVALMGALKWSMDRGAVEYLMEFRDQQKAELISFVDDLLDHPNLQHRHLGLAMALRLAPDSKSLLPKVIATLPDPNDATGYKEGDKGSRELTLRTLATLDKDWGKHPSVRAALAPLIADAGEVHPRETRPIYKLLAELGTDARPSVPDVIRTMVKAKSGYFAHDSAVALGKMDPDWREHPTVKEILPELISRLAKGDFTAESHLKYLGSAASAELEKALPTFNADVRTRAAALIGGAGAAGGSEAAVAALFKQLTDPDTARKEVGLVLKSLSAMNRDWPTLPEVRKLTPEVLGKLATPDTQQVYTAVAAALGPASVPDLVKHLAGPKLVQRQMALAALSEVGPGAASALPAVLKALKDKDAEVRKRAVHTVGRIGAGKKDVVSALAPAFLDQDSEVFRNVPDAMDRLDKDWKKSPKLNPVVNQLVKSLGNPDPKARGIALYSLSFIGPAPGVVAAVERLAKQEKDGNVRQQALNVLNSFKRQQ